MPWAASEEVQLAGWSRWLCPSTLSSWDVTWSTWVFNSWDLSTRTWSCRSGSRGGPWERFRSLKHISYENRLRQLEYFSLEKQRLWGDLRAASQYLQENWRGASSNRTRSSGFKLKDGSFRLAIILHYEDGEALAQVVQRCCWCLTSGNTQTQARCDFDKPGLVESVPVSGRGIGTKWLLWSLQTQAILCFYDSTLKREERSHFSNDFSRPWDRWSLFCKPLKWNIVLSR